MNPHHSDLPDFPPLFASGEWWRIRFAALLAGESEAAAVEKANRTATEMGLLSRRGWMRFDVTGGNTTPGITTLSMPVKGGASALKNHDPASWRVSPHRDAASTIDATLATLYGRTPFFHLTSHLVSLSPAYDFEHAASYCMARDSALMRILGLDNPDVAHQARELLEQRTGLASELRESALRQFNPRLSILDSIFRQGRYTIYALLPALTL